MTRDDDARLDDLLAHLGEGDTKELFRTLLQRGMQELIDTERTIRLPAMPHGHRLAGPGALCVDDHRHFGTKGRRSAKLRSWPTCRLSARRC